MTEDKLKTDNSETKHNPEKSTQRKHSKTKLLWFSRFLQRSARKQGGLILQRSPAHMWPNLSEPIPLSASGILRKHK